MEGTVMGTPHYMSPEQAEGRVAEIDQQSDVFSLGGILYAILTLRSPVEGRTLDSVLDKVRGGTITPPTLLGTIVKDRGPGEAGPAPAANDPAPDLPHIPGGHVPPALSAVVMKALTVDKARRYATVAAFAADIEAYQGGFATSAEQASLMKQLLLLIQRHKGVFLTGFIAWLVITALAVWFVISIKASESKATRNAELAAKNAQEAKTEATRAVAAEKLAEENAEDTRHALAKSQIALAESGYRDHDAAAMQAALKDVPDDLRDSNWSYLLEHADNSIVNLRRELFDVAAHPKKPGVFAVLGSDGSVSLLEVATGLRFLNFKAGLQKANTEAYRFAMSPDGERLAIGANGSRGIVIHSTADGSKLAEWDSEKSGRLQFSPDGKRLLQTCRSANEVRLLDASTGANIWTSKSEGAVQQNRAVFTPDGQKVITFSNKDRLRLLSAKDGSLMRTFYSGSGGENGIAVRPNKPQILTATQDGVVRCIQNTDDGRLIYQFHAEDTALTDIAYTADGSRIVTLANLAGGQQSIKVWDAEKGSLLQTLMGGSGAGRRIGVHPLSSEIVVIGQNSKVWSLPAAQEKWAFPLPSNTGGGTFWGTDDLILTLVGKGNVGAGLVDLRKPDPRNQPTWEASRTNDSGNFTSITVSADGRFAAIGMPISATDAQKPVQFLRLNGDTVEVVKAFRTKTPMNNIQLSPDGGVLQIYGRLFDPATGKELFDLLDKDRVAFNASAWVGKTKLVGAVTAFKARGREGSVERLNLWDATNGQLLQSVDNPTAILCLAARPGAPLFAEAGTDRIVRLRDANTLEVKREFRAHDGAITAMEFHPTRPILATASDDLTVKLWDLDTGRCLEELRGPVGSTRRLSISPGGKRLACWADKVTRIWEPKCFTEKTEEKVDADGWENLLAQLKPESVAETGNGWQLRSGVLFSASKSKAAIPLPGSFGQGSYHVRVKLRAMTPDQTFVVLLPVAGQTVAFVLQGIPADKSQRKTYLTAAKAAAEPGTIEGQVLKDSELHELEIAVHIEGDNTRIETRFDDAPLHQWSGPVSALIVREDWGAVPKDAIALGTHIKDWVVYAVKAKRLGAGK